MQKLDTRRMSLPLRRKTGSTSCELRIQWLKTSGLQSCANFVDKVSKWSNPPAYHHGHFVLCGYCVYLIWTWHYLICLQYHYWYVPMLLFSQCVLFLVSWKKNAVTLHRHNYTTFSLPSPSPSSFLSLPRASVPCHHSPPAISSVQWGHLEALLYYSNHSGCTIHRQKCFRNPIQEYS